MNTPSKQPSGMRGYLFIQVGQFLSFTGSGMTRFALTLYAWQLTGEATPLALAAFFGFLPVILFSPIAGALTDRWNRKLAMMMSDFGAASSTLLLLVLSLSGDLQIWHIYVAVFIAGAFETFQFPAYSATMSLMIPKEQYARASAMGDLVGSGSAILSPILAAALFGIIGLNGIMLIDLLSFSFAFGTLIWVLIPNPPPSDPEKRNSLWEDSLFGFKYILARPSLLGLQMIFFFGNLLYSVGNTLHAPIVLARTDSNEQILAVVNMAMAIGGVVGSLVIAWWGGFQKRIYGVTLAWILSALFGLILFGMAQTTLVWVIAGFLAVSTLSLVNASNQALWMSKVPSNMQGRVFSIRRLVAQVTAPFGMLMAGLLSDNVFEPAMQPGGALASVFGGLVGTGAGAGMSLLTMLCGVLLVITTLSLFAMPHIRHVESIIPDAQHDTAEVPV
jgi:MFS transporter, DHA3 family, macrolide efflux protein